MARIADNNTKQESLSLETEIKKQSPEEILIDSNQASLPTMENSTNKDAMDESLSEMMGDAPACPTCGHITVRNGSCYKCLNCGDSLGCS